MLKRLEYTVDLTDPSRDVLHQKRIVASNGEGNLFSSEVVTKPGWHAPTLDIDEINVEVIESTTPGNYHLYIDKAMPWEDYIKLLQVLREVGICQAGFVGLSMARGASFLRKPGVKKMPQDVGDS